MGVLNLINSLKISVLYFVLVFLFSCSTPLKNKKEFRDQGFCFSHEKTTLEKRIPLNGFYHFPNKYLGCVFYPNGFYIEDYSETGFLERKKYHRDRTNKVGVYILVGDTIKTKLVYTESMNRYFEENWYLLENKQISPIFFRNKKLSRFYIGETGSFFETDTLPNPNRFWIMDKKWFYCD